MAPRGPVGDEAFARDVGISWFAFCTPCGQPRKLLRSSSGAKSRRVSQVPASRPITSRPACASGSAATPPAAPSPMMTTSMSLSRVAMSHPCLPVRIEGAEVRRTALAGARRRLGERIVVVRRLVIRLQLTLLEPLLIDGGDHGAHAGITDEIPADEVRVAAVVRIAERALMRVAEHQREEGGGAAGESSRRTGLDVDEHRILIDRRQLGERLTARRARIPIERGETGGVRLA